MKQDEYEENTYDDAYYDEDEYYGGGEAKQNTGKYSR